MAVGRKKDAQGIGVHGEIKKFVVTLVVMRHFFILLGAPRVCVDFCDPTAVSRIIGDAWKWNNAVQDFVFQVEGKLGEKRGSISMYSLKRPLAV
jgi:hypothetical protein